MVQRTSTLRWRNISKDIAGDVDGEKNKLLEQSLPDKKYGAV
jgi:hypothetical protein